MKFDLTIIDRVHTNAKFPLAVTRGTEKQRFDKASALSRQFYTKLDKLCVGEDCQKSDYINTLIEVLHPYKIAFKVKTNDKNKVLGYINTITENKQLNRNTLKMTCVGYEISLPMENSGSIITDKYCAAHEARHLFDSLFNPKGSLMHETNLLKKSSTYEKYKPIFNSIGDMFLFNFDRRINMKDFEKNVRNIMASLPDDLAVDLLQNIRFTLKSEINAYADEIKLLKKGLGFINNLERILLCKYYLKVNAKYPEKLKLANTLLKERLYNVRAENKKLYGYN